MEAGGRDRANAINSSYQTSGSSVSRLNMVIDNQGTVSETLWRTFSEPKGYWISSEVCPRASTAVVTGCSAPISVARSSREMTRRRSGDPSRGR